MTADTLMPGFLRRDVETSGARIRVATAGSGPPVLLLHGHPQNHLTWHKVAPRLAEPVHRGRARPARLRRLRKAGGRRRPCEL